jgi:hypothetical protein
MRRFSFVGQLTGVECVHEWYDTITMCSGQPSIVLVFAKALRLAQRSGRSEMDIETLLAALDDPLVPNEAAPPIGGRFVPVPHAEMRLSKEAQTAIEAAAPQGTFSAFHRMSFGACSSLPYRFLC